MPARLLLIAALALSASCAAGSKDKAVHRVPASQIGDARGVRFASTDGRFVGLSDGSLWNIDWRHAEQVRNWRAGDKVRVRETGAGGSFPYRLTAPDGSTAAARLGKKLD